MPDILSHPEFDPLEDVERERIRAALRDPEQRWAYLTGTVALLRKEGQRREADCVGPGGCRERLTADIGRLKRFRSWLLGLGAGIGILLSLLAALQALGVFK